MRLLPLVTNRFPGFALLLAALCAVSVGATRAGAAQPNLVLLSVDTLRADHLGCYGYDKPTSPNIDALAAKSLLFEDFLCEVPLTSPSMCSMLTGRYPRMLGLTRNGVQLPPETPVVAEQFQRAGYATWCVQSNWTLKGELCHLNRGFDVYQDDFHKGRWGALKSERPANEVADIALKLLAERDTEKPFFAWIHFTDPHGPYTFREDYNAWDKKPWRLGSAEKVRVQYDSEVRYTDFHIGRVLEVLPPDTIIVFLADHGESLYEHGYLGHGRRLYQNNVHVPLLIHTPTLAPGRSKAPARGVDVASTLLGLAGLPALEGATGVEVVATPPAADRIRFAEAYGGAAVGPASVREAMAAMAPDAQAVIADGWKLIVDGGKTELYFPAEDPHELNSRFAAERARAESMRTHLEHWNAIEAGKTAAPHEMSADDVEALRALGYIK